ncbi:hypothetical protein Bca4012_084714 [Brassica carinata]
MKETLELRFYCFFTIMEDIDNIEEHECAFSRNYFLTNELGVSSGLLLHWDMPLCTCVSFILFLQLLRPQLEELRREMGNKGTDPEAMAEGQRRMQLLFKQHGVTPFTPPQRTYYSRPHVHQLFLCDQEHGRESTVI